MSRIMPPNSSGVDEHAVSFNADDMLELVTMARQRYEPKRAAGVADHQVAGLSGFEVDFAGLAGELAAATFFGVKVRQLYGKCGDGGEYDLDVNGTKIEVKTLHRYLHRYHLLFPHSRVFTADIAVLVRPLGPTMAQLVGWTTREEYAENMHYHPYFLSPETRGMEGYLLHPMSTLNLKAA